MKKNRARTKLLPINMQNIEMVYLVEMRIKDFLPLVHCVTLPRYYSDPRYCCCPPLTPVLRNVTPGCRLSRPPSSPSSPTRPYGSPSAQDSSEAAAVADQVRRRC